MSLHDDDVADSNKKITLVGVNTRYQIKKVLRIPTTKARANWVDLPADMNNATSQIALLTAFDSTLIKEITNKLNGYKHQDVLKNRFAEQSFITLQQTVGLLDASQLVCFYCHCFTPILYKMVRDGAQWSLDRIDNNIGHTHSNVVISCLKCNLQRKRVSANTFAMSKQLVLTRDGL